jgi:hypothetical protein
MHARRTREELEASITKDTSLPREGRFLVSEPGDGTRISLFFQDYSYLPSGMAREIGMPPNTIMVLWGNPTRMPGRKAATFVATTAAHVSVRKVRQELGCALDDALPIAELIGYALDMDVQGR